MHVPESCLSALAQSSARRLLAHHSYAMFDGTQTQTVDGTVAKLEWTNPHVFVWVYVPNAQAPAATTSTPSRTARRTCWCGAAGRRPR